MFAAVLEIVVNLSRHVNLSLKPNLYEDSMTRKRKNTRYFSGFTQNLPPIPRNYLTEFTMYKQTNNCIIKMYINELKFIRK